MKIALDIALAKLEGVRAAPRVMERVYALEARYRDALPVPAIPIRMDPHGVLALSRDGNHRLSAARRAGVTHVRVKIDARLAPELERLYGAVPAPSPPEFPGDSDAP